MCFPPLAEGGGKSASGPPDVPERRVFRNAGWAVPECDPIPHRLLNTYTTHQVANVQVLVEMWKCVGLHVGAVPRAGSLSGETCWRMNPSSVPSGKGRGDAGPARDV